MEACPFCKGRKRVPSPIVPEGELCLSCNGTGDYETMKLTRACRLGEAAGYARAVSMVAPELYPDGVRELGFTTIEAAVIDDVRRQRYEEALSPRSPVRLKLEEEVARLLRERAPLLASLGELRERVVARLG